MPNDWSRRDPNVFPIAFSNTLLRAIEAGPNRPVIFPLEYPTIEAARSMLNHFRYYRFCIRKMTDGRYQAQQAAERDFRLATRVTRIDRDGGRMVRFGATLTLRPRVTRHLSPALLESLAVP